MVRRRTSNAESENLANRLYMSIKETILSDCPDVLSLSDCVDLPFQRENISTGSAIIKFISPINDQYGLFSTLLA